MFSLDWATIARLLAVALMAYSALRTTTMCRRVYRTMEFEGSFPDTGAPVLEPRSLPRDWRRGLELAVFCVFGWLWWICVDKWRRS